MGQILMIMMVLYGISKLFKLPEKLGKALDNMVEEVSKEEGQESKTDWRAIVAEAKRARAEGGLAEVTTLEELYPEWHGREATVTNDPPAVDSVPPRDIYLCSEDKYTKGKVFEEGRGYVSVSEHASAEASKSHQLLQEPQEGESSPIALEDLREALREDLPKSMLLAEILQRKY